MKRQITIGVLLFATGAFVGTVCEYIFDKKTDMPDFIFEVNSSAVLLYGPSANQFTCTARDSDISVKAGVREGK